MRQYTPSAPAWRSRAAQALRVAPDVTTSSTSTTRFPVRPAPDSRANAQGAYSLLPGAGLTGRRVVLVDDVVTSGATLSACAALLRQAGAEGVYCLTLAQARSH